MCSSVPIRVFPWASVILFASVRIFIDSRSPKCECNNGKRPVTKFVLKLVYNENVHAFRKVIPSLWNSKIEAIKVLEINFRKNQSATWSETVISFLAGNFRGILGIHSIKSFSGDDLSWCDQKIEFSFNYKNSFF